MVIQGCAGVIFALLSPMVAVKFPTARSFGFYVFVFVRMFRLLSVLSLLVGCVISISDELAAEFGYPAGVDVW